MKRIFLYGVLLCAFYFSGITSALACKWDYDTLKMEQQRFPGTLQLLSGKFLRHSKDFYKWRIQNRLEKLKKNPDKLSYYDDIAAAFDSIGQPQKGIEWMLKKEKKKPGLYETYANLGTFYIHNKQLKKGLGYIKKAIKINPNAHFGREIYQAYLVEYILFLTKGGKLSFPLSKLLEKKQKEKPQTEMQKWMKDKFAGEGFSIFLRAKNKDWRSYKQWDAQRGKAIKGVLGMMRFGNFRSPVLLEALGDLLGSRGNNDAKRMAARAYLHASFEVKDAAVKKLYIKKAKQALSMQANNPDDGNQLTLKELHKDYQNEIAEGEAWFAKIKKDEQEWIKKKLNPEKEYDKKYYKKPILKAAPLNKRGAFALSHLMLLLGVGLFIILAFIGMRVARP